MLILTNDESDWCFVRFLDGQLNEAAKRSGTIRRDALVLAGVLGQGEYDVQDGAVALQLHVTGVLQKLVLNRELSLSVQKSALESTT
jgi:hypothetical protein